MWYNSDIPFGEATPGSGFQTTISGFRFFSEAEPESECAVSDFTEQFSITSTRRGDCYVVRPDGDLDIATASQLAEALAFAPNVEVDLSQVTFIDSSGLHVLVQARLRIIDAGGKFGVSGANSSILRILEITGLEHLLDMDVDTLTSNGN